MKMFFLWLEHLTPTLLLTAIVLKLVTYNLSLFVITSLLFGTVMTIAFNTRTFAISFLFFFSFFPSRHFFWMDCQKLFSKRFIISYQESVWPRSDSFLGHTEKYFLKNCSLSCPSWRVWHMTQLMHGNQHS